MYVDLSYSGIFCHHQLLSNIFLRLQNLCEIVFLIQPLYHQATEQRGWVGLWIYARLKGKMHNEVKWCVQRSQLTCHASQQKSWINSTMLVKITRGIKMWEVGWFDMSQTTPTTIEYEEHTYTTHIPAWWRLFKQIYAYLETLIILTSFSVSFAGKYSSGWQQSSIIIGTYGQL